MLVMFEVMVLSYILDNRDLKEDGCQSNLYVMLKQILFFTSFTTAFVDDIL